ncbi:23S rRNA pseudouridine955/2504/2580 synthase [Eilatimonas milleporae]|uniref:Pseudouridine synthase n=2 Tax=Eilatimonas milleporae TaxID=911205 RepID=A0A3M0C3S9_9PROT|nr:23S rRNA pseudouridine955/2504/2580 synthase [Eilatimonas milleporae]
MSGVRHMKVTPEDAGLRLDRWFRRHVPEAGFGAVQKAMRKGAVRLDGRRVKGNERLETGQDIRVPPFAGEAGLQKNKTAPCPALDDATVAEVRGWVIYKDDKVIALNKPPGLPTQGGTGQKRHLDGLLDALKYDAPERPRLVHRLDKDTSGVLLLGRTANAAAALAKNFASKDTDKRYWALVTGVPKEPMGRIRLTMDKVAVRGAERMVVSPDGKPSLTDYAIMDRAGKRAAWLALKPHTGRTHQLRLHTAEIGHPIVGDGKYGGEDAYLGGVISKKLHLHAESIAFTHPDGGRLRIAAPMPPHIKASFEALGFNPADHEDPFVDM